jgi:predicted metalloendopeptidase
LLGTIALACRAPETEKSTKPEPWLPEGADTTVLPVQDFYRFATGGWPGNEPPALLQTAASDFDRQLLELLRDRLAVRNNYPEGTDQRKLADFFYISMDSVRADRLGMQPLRPLLRQIGSLDEQRLTPYLAGRALVGENPFFETAVRQQAPDQPWRLTIEPPLVRWGQPAGNVAEARNQLAQLLRQAGLDEKSAIREAQIALQVETELMEGIPPVPQQPVLRSTTELDKLYPFIDWPGWLNALGITTDSVLVANPLYMRACQRVVDGFKAEELQSYLRCVAVWLAAPYLGRDQRRELPIASRQSRWQQVVADCRLHFGDVLGRWYVRENFSKEIEAEARLLVDNCRLAFASQVKERTWMSDSTKQGLLQSLRSMQVFVGHPEQWQALTALQLPKDSLEQSYYHYISQLRAYANRLQWQKIVSQTEAIAWPVAALEPRLYFDAVSNRLFLPAAILRPPLFQPTDPGVHYARLGYLVSLEFAQLLMQMAADRPAEFAPWRQAVAVWHQGWLKSEEKISMSNRLLLDEARHPVALAIAAEALERYLRETPGISSADGVRKRFLAAWPQHHTGPNASACANAALQHFEPFVNLFKPQVGDGMWVEPGKRVAVW